MLRQKDLSFPQVVAGPGFESVVTVTNRGDEPYQGVADFWTGQAQAWNPRVNGVRIADARLHFVVESGETMILRIHDDVLIAGVVAIRAGDLSYDNFIEGNLTYSYQASQYDSVGILPAVELYRSVVPFEDFHAIGLALANPHPGESATVTLRLVDAQGIELETVIRELPGRFHEARYLNEIFSTGLAAGKVEIESTALIMGTALTLTGGEISALPLLPSPVSYTVYFRYRGITDKAEVVLWAEGVFVQGYMRFVLIAGQVNEEPATYLVSGTLFDGVLRLTQFGAGPVVGIQETINALKVPNFTFSRSSFTGGFTRVFPWLSFPTNQLLGNYELIRKD